jgi:hypothetical protein
MKTLLKFILYVMLCMGIAFLSIAPASAQQKIQVQGVVVDTDTNAPIENVHIVNITETKKEHAVSAKNGYFQSVFSKGDTIKVSCIGYEPVYLKINKPSLTDTLKILLVAEQLELAPIFITDKKIIKVYQDEKYYVLDFLLDNQGVIILAANYVNKKYFIRKYNYANEKIAERYLDFKPKDVCFKDYLGRTFIFDNQGNTYQFWRNKRSFEIRDVEIKHEDFMPKIAGYHFQHQDKLFTTIYNDPQYPDMGLVQYYEPEKESPYILKSIYNRAVLDEKSDPFVMKFAVIHPAMLKTFLMPISVYAPVFKIPDTILLFDHTNCEINIYNDSLQLLSTVKMTLSPSQEGFFSQRDTWIFARRIIQDGSRFFALFQNNSGRKFQLWEIDYRTGQIIKKTTLEQPCPKHIQVKHNNAYYIYKELATEDKYGLFMQRLD